MNDQIDTRSLFAPKKGKQATKGQKQIYEGNQETIKFYAIMAFVSIMFHITPTLLFSWRLNTFLTVFEILVQVLGIAGMNYMAKPVLSGPSNVVVDGGIDLNLKGGFADYLKDLIITTTICTALSIISNWFWLLWLWLPGLFVFKIWTSFIAPWIFEPAPEEPPKEVADKKKRKMERKMARAGYR